MFNAASYGAFPLRGTTRHGSAQLGSARFAFPLQFSTALEWDRVNFVIPRRSITLSLDPLLGYQREERLYFLNRQRNSHFFGC